MLRMCVVIAVMCLVSATVSAASAKQLVMGPCHLMGAWGVKVTVADVKKHMGPPAGVEIMQIESAHMPIPNLVVRMRYEDIDIDVRYDLVGKSSSFLACGASGDGLKKFGLAPGMTMDEVQQQYGNAMIRDVNMLAYEYPEFEDAHTKSHTVKLSFDRGLLVSALWDYTLE